jgi:hypothetical protein
VWISDPLEPLKLACGVEITPERAALLAVGEDDDAETIAKRKRLQDEIAEKRKQTADKFYDKLVEKYVLKKPLRKSAAAISWNSPTEAESQLKECLGEEDFQKIAEDDTNVDDLTLKYEERNRRYNLIAEKLENGEELTESEEAFYAGILEDQWMGESDLEEDEEDENE